MVRQHPQDFANLSVESLTTAGNLTVGGNLSVSGSATISVSTTTGKTTITANTSDYSLRVIQNGSGLGIQIGTAATSHSLSGNVLMITGAGEFDGKIWADGGLQVTSGNLVLSTSNNFKIYNTADETTNTEFISLAFESNVAVLKSTITGAGVTARTLSLRGYNSNGIGYGFLELKGTGAPFINFGASTTATTGSIATFTFTSNASSGTVNFWNITPTINQSGTAGYNVLHIDATETTTGSGDKYLVNVTKASVLLFGINSNGTIVQKGGRIRKRTVPGAYPYALLANDDIIAVTDTSAPRSITLPTAASALDSRIYVIKDESLGAGTNNITISTTGGDTIEGAASVVINTNGGSVSLYTNGGTSWFIY